MDNLAERIEVLIGPFTFEQVGLTQLKESDPVTVTSWNHPTAQPSEAQLQAVTAEQIAAIRAKRTAKMTLETTDDRMSRPMEDVIDALVAKGVIATTDLPQTVQTLLSERKVARNALK